MCEIFAFLRGNAGMKSEYLFLSAWWYKFAHDLYQELTPDLRERGFDVYLGQHKHGTAHMPQFYPF